MFYFFVIYPQQLVEREIKSEAFFNIYSDLGWTGEWGWGGYYKGERHSLLRTV
jgi:hypothetical protein